MTWEEKLVALQDLGDCSLRMRSPGDWYVDLRGAEIKEVGLLVSPTGSAETPAEAIDEIWAIYANADVVVIKAGSRDRREVTWVRHMWKSV